MAVLLGGLVSGCLYALIALGLVLIFRSSHAVTFALGDVGVAGALVAAATVKGAHGLPIAAAVVLGIVVGAAVNVAVYAVAVRLLERRKADISTMIASTLGLSIVLDGLLQQHYGFNPYTSTLFHQFRGFSISGVNVPGPGLAIIISAVVAFAALSLVLRYSRAGLKLRMGAANPELTEITGVRSLPIRLIVWALAGALAAWAMILFSAYSAVSTYGAAEFLLTAAVAASFGAFRNIPLTVLGAVVLAIVVDLCAQHAAVDVTALASLTLVVPVFIIRQWQAGGGALARGTGILIGRWHTRAVHRMRRGVTLGEFVVVAVVGLALTFVVNQYWTTILQQVASAVIVIAGLSISVRYQGRLNLGAAGYVLLGEYAVAVGSSHGYPLIVCAIVGMLAGAVLGAVVGALTANMAEMYYATITLLVTTAVPELALWLSSWTGGAQGVSIDPTYFGIHTFGGVPIVVVVSMVLAVLVLGGTVVFGRSRLAARMLTSVADPDGASASGVRRWRQIVGGEFCGSALMVLGGVVFAATATYVSPTDLGLSASVYLLAALIIGGGWSPIGIALGACVYVIVPAQLSSLGNWISVIYGGGLVVFILFTPDGLEAALARLYLRRPRAADTRAVPQPQPQPQPARSAR